MRKKFFTLALVSFLIALVIYAFTYYMYHYIGPDGHFGALYQNAPVKPLVTVYFGIWGVMYPFIAVVSFLIGLIFFPKNKSK